MGLFFDRLTYAFSSLISERRFARLKLLTLTCWVIPLWQIEKDRFQPESKWIFSFFAYFWSSFVPLRNAEEKKTELKNFLCKKENCESKETS
jgi:hypothetical protein